VAGAAAGHAGATDADVHKWGDLGRRAEADQTEDHHTKEGDRAQDDPEDHGAEGRGAQGGTDGGTAQDGAEGRRAQGGTDGRTAQDDGA